MERQEFTVRKWPLYFTAAIFIFLLVYLNDTGKIKDIDSLPVLIGLTVLILIYFLLSKNKLLIDNDGITQRSFFGRLKELKWNEIISSSINWSFHGHTADLSWEFIDFSGNLISIQTSYYSRNKLKLIAIVLLEKSQQALADERIKNIAAGKFPWYIL